MTTTWDVLNNRLSYFLSDVPRTAGGAAYKHPLLLRLEAWNWAQREFAQHTAREMVVSPLNVEPDGRSALLPDDFFEIVQVYDADNAMIYAPRHFASGGYRSDNSEDFVFWVWGDVLHFEATVTTKLALYYYAYWPEVTWRFKDDDQIEILQDQISVPKWAELPLLHLTAAGVLQPMAIESARNREYATKIDSGTPDDNARRTQAREQWWWYHELMGQHRPQDRVKGVGG
jgi:hypothetical protein